MHKRLQQHLDANRVGEGRLLFTVMRGGCDSVFLVDKIDRGTAVTLLILREHLLLMLGCVLVHLETAEGRLPSMSVEDGCDFCFLACPRSTNR